MYADYLDWLTEVFEEAQVPFDPSSAELLDRALHRIAGVEYPQRSEEQVYNILRERYLKVGPPGRQLLAAYLRDAVYSRRDSPLRPVEGQAHYTNTRYHD